MIVLDEQLLGYGLRKSIKRWYRGRVAGITELRPGTVITDDAIPVLLRTAPRPCFVTINVTDFWRQLAPDPRFCIVCVAVPDSRVEEVSEHLRRLFATPPFQTRRNRLGKIARVSSAQIQYYTVDSWAIQRIEQAAP